MFFIASKFFAYILNPLFWILVILIISAFSKKNIIKQRLLISSIVLLYLFSNKFLYQKIENIITFPPLNSSELNTTYDYGIVMGGFSSYDSKNEKIVFKETADRLLQAVDLYFKHKISKIILTGGSAKIFVEEKKEADFTKEFLINMGIPESDIISENSSKNTYENAVNTSRLIDIGKHKVLIITSSTHIYRSAKCFAKLGIKADIFPVDYEIQEKPSIGDILIPDTNVFSKWTKLIHEFIGIISYKMKNYI